MRPFWSWEVVGQMNLVCFDKWLKNSIHNMLSWLLWVQGMLIVQMFKSSTQMIGSSGRIPGQYPGILLGRRLSTWTTLWITRDIYSAQEHEKMILDKCSFSTSSMPPQIGFLHSAVSPGVSLSFFKIFTSTGHLCYPVWAMPFFSVKFSTLTVCLLHIFDTLQQKTSKITS